MSSGASLSEAVLKDELTTLRILRATLESVKQLVEAIHQDTVTAAENYRSLAGLHKRWHLAIEQSRDNDGGTTAAKK